MESFFGVGIAELFFIALIALIVLGPERLPSAIREVSKHIRYFRNISSELTAQFSEEMKVLEDLHPQRIMDELTGEADAKQAAAKTVKKPTKKPTTAKSASATTAAKAVTATGSATAAEQKKSGATESPSTGSATADTKESAASDSLQSAEDAAQQASAPETQVENTILPPQTEVAAESISNAPVFEEEKSEPAKAASTEPEDYDKTPPEQTGPEQTGDDRANRDDSEAIISDAEPSAVENTEAQLDPAPAARRTPVSVNGKGAESEGEG